MKERIAKNYDRMSMSRFIPLILLLILLLFSMTQASEISVQVSGGIEKIEAFDEFESRYFSMSQLSEILGEKITWDIVGISAAFESEDHRVVFFINSPSKNHAYQYQFDNNNL